MMLTNTGIGPHGYAYGSPHAVKTIWPVRNVLDSYTCVPSLWVSTVRLFASSAINESSVGSPSMQSVRSTINKCPGYRAEGS